MGLNREQRRAAADLAGPVRIVAGAGTGKTAVITERFQRLVASGAPPESILVMTFTDRAAGEMRTRIETNLGSYAGDLWVGTFHSVAQSLLREEGWRVGVPPAFRIVAGADRWILMRELLWELGDPALVGAERPDDLVNPLLRLLERMKQELVAPARLEDWARTAEDRELGEQLLAAVRLFRAYRRRCEAEKQLDFDDLILRLVALLEERPGAMERHVKRFTSVLVDEYQDSNLAQERMVELLGAGGNVCVVGDDDQSIYRFRGASLASMERFVRSFPGTVTRSLGQNRRSTANIVAGGAALITNNSARMSKSLTAFRGPGPKVQISHAASGLEESLDIASQIVALADGGTALDRIAILIRTNALARPLVGALQAAGIPHQLWGARGYYRRPEVLDVIAYLRLLNDPSDEIAIARLCARPGAGLDSVEVLTRMAAGRGSGEHPLAALEGWQPAREWVGKIRRLIGLSARLGIDELFFELMASTGYLEVATFESESEQRQVAANLGKFSEVIDGFRDHGRDHSLRAFMAYLELVLLSEIEEEVARLDDVEQAVQVMTIHQAKGLEFDAVFVPALVEGRLPQPHRGDRFRVPAFLAGETAGREDQVAEERRLLYVAMTRARDILRLSFADHYEGSRSWRRSRFLDEVETAGPRHLQTRDAPTLGAPALAGAPDAGALELAGSVRSAGVARTSRPPSSTDPGGPPIPLPTLSYSGISTYRECPRQYQFRYVHRLPAPATVEAEYGNLVHGTLMSLGRLRQTQSSVTREDLTQVHQQSWEHASFPDSRRMPAMRALALGQLERYWSAGGFSARPALIEQAFTAELEGWRLRGIIDRVDPPDDRIAAEGVPPEQGQPADRWRIVDYKTGDPMPASRLRRDLQLALYALGARHALGIEGAELEIVYLRDASRVVLAAEDSLLSEAEVIGREVAKGVSEGRFEARPERRRCSLCPYRLACPAAL